MRRERRYEIPRFSTLDNSAELSVSSYRYGNSILKPSRSPCLKGHPVGHPLYTDLVAHGCESWSDYMEAHTSVFRILGRVDDAAKNCTEIASRRRHDTWESVSCLLHPRRRLAHEWLFAWRMNESSDRIPWHYDVCTESSLERHRDSFRR